MPVDPENPSEIEAFPVYERRRRGYVPHMAQEPLQRPRRSRIHDAGVRFATSWARRYTQRVPPRLAERRQDEVAFELWEFEIARDRYRWSGPRAGCSLVVRTVLGARRDLVWRRAAQETGLPLLAPVRLMSRRRRPRIWVPLQLGHTFDQTNGAIDAEQALPYERPSRSFGAAGNAFGAQGGF